MPQEKDPNEIGALWCKVSGKGRPYMSGVIEGKSVVVFPKKKTSDKQPDYVVLLSKPREATNEPGGFQ